MKKPTSWIKETSLRLQDALTVSIADFKAPTIKLNI